MIVYLLIIIFFVLLIYNKNESFVNYRDVYSENKGQKIYKGMYKCNEYDDIRLNILK
jgi:hypothetical protein